MGKLDAAAWLGAAGILAAALTACGGGASAPSAVPALGPATAAGSGNLAFAITAPAGTGTASLGLALKGQTAPLATVNLAAGSPGCSPSASATVCTVSVTAPAGKDFFLVTAYDGANGSGHKLSIATVPGTIGTTSTNRIPLTLGTTVASVSVVLGSDGLTVPVGSPASIAVTVVAFDAQNNIIAGPGNFSTPVTLTNSDTSGATSLSSASVPSPGTSVTLNYTGASLGAATITPMLNATAGTPDTFSPAGSAFVTYLLPSPSDEAAAMAAGPDGNMWYTTFGGQLQFAAAGSVTPQGLATVYSANLPQAYIQGLASGPGNQLWFGDDNMDIGTISTSGAVAFAGTFAPCGTSTCGTVNAMVAGTDNNLWFTDNSGYIGRVQPPLNFSAPGASVMEWSLPALPGTPPGASEPNFLAYANGSVYVGDYAGYVEKITTDNAGTATGITAVSLPGGCEGYTIAIGPDGNVWFTDDCGNIGMIPIGNFSAGGLLEWNYFASDGNALLTRMIASPAGLWATNDDDGNVYLFSNLAGVSAPAGPTMTAVQVFSSSAADAFTLALGADQNIWVMSDDTGGVAPPAMSRISTGLVTGGTNLTSLARRLSTPASHVRIVPRRPLVHGKRGR